jgi:hypothetical protein
MIFTTERHRGTEQDGKRHFVTVRQPGTVVLTDTE